jgi:putative nucleotidyltransferase with HDIG domain
MLKEIRARMKMVQVGVATSIAAGIATFFVNLADGQVSWSEPAKAMLAAMAGISLVLVLLPVIERFFKVTTSLTLLEWADTSRPLLRQLIEKAPGTWQHSHMLGNMAEAAAEEIGANGLLARVGAFYHDVGKICKPHYFVENQQANINAHTGLAPTMSLLVILAHVKDGLALAREHGVPYVLHQFIAEHHGTTVVKYFHAMAAQEAKAGGPKAREVSETEFRYPGPRPRSKETAILMLCDGVEGAVRTLSDPTPGRIEARVHDIVMNRMMDGQFDDCDITLKDLARIEQSLVKSLRAIHHGRISYPTTREPAEAAVRTA